MPDLDPETEVDPTAPIARLKAFGFERRFCGPILPNKDRKIVSLCVYTQYVDTVNQIVNKANASLKVWKFKVSVFDESHIIEL